MATGQLFKTPENIEKFVSMIMLGITKDEIMKEIGIKRATYYDWLEDSRIIAELDKRRLELKTDGMNFVRGRYKKYLENIDKLCNDMGDKRTALQANTFMIEKLDGKNTTKIDITSEVVEKVISDDDIDSAIAELDEDKD